MTCNDALDCFSSQQDNNQGQYTQLAVLPTEVKHESDPPPINTMSTSSSATPAHLRGYQLLAVVVATHPIWLSTLDLSSQVPVGHSNRTLFRAMQTNQLLHLLAKYEIKVRADKKEKKDEYLQRVLKQQVYLTLDDEKGNPVQKQVKNPILLLAYAIIQKNPAILAIESNITDDSCPHYHLEKP